MTGIADTTEKATPGSWTGVLGIFLRLGLTSFGGPIAHLGYFQDILQGMFAGIISYPAYR